jgi:hypothetical protein
MWHVQRRMRDMHEGFAHLVAAPMAARRDRGHFDMFLNVFIYIKNNNKPEMKSSHSQPSILSFVNPLFRQSSLSSILSFVNPLFCLVPEDPTTNLAFN